MNHDGNEQFKWLLCPVCGSETRSQIGYSQSALTLLTSGKLYEHFAAIDTSACNMAEYLIKEMAKRQSVMEGKN